MSQRSHGPDTTDEHSEQQPAAAPKADFSTKLTIYKDIADVTWRMFVPSVSGAIIGVILDRTFRTKPLWTIVGVTVGFTVVVFLVWRQIRATNASDKDSQ